MSKKLKTVSIMNKKITPAE